MDISNSLVPSNLTNSVNSNRRLEVEQQKNRESDNTQKSQSASFVPVSRQTSSANPDLLANKSREIQQDRVQRVNSLESAPIKTQQAFNRYQQTIDAGTNSDQGQLVGIDLFV